MTNQYLLVNVQEPEDRTYEVENIINELADEGWEVVGYSAHGWRGITTAGFSHLALLVRERKEEEEGDVVRCPRCRVANDVPDNDLRVLCHMCDLGFDLAPRDN